MNGAVAVALVELAVAWTAPMNGAVAVALVELLVLDRRRRHLGLVNVVDLDVVDERNALLIVSTGCLCTSWA